MKQRKFGLVRDCLIEATATFILMFIGLGAVHGAVYCGAQSGIWQIAIVWAVAVMLAIYAIGSASGTHMNPAMTVVFCIYRRFPLKKAFPFFISQFVGTFVAAALLYLLFHGIIEQFEAAKGIIRGAPGSELSAMGYTDYFPNPLFMGVGAKAWASVSVLQAWLAEAIGTALLAFFVFALTEERSHSRPELKHAPLFIGLGVAIIISALAPLSMAGINPVKDFAPRLFAYLVGWGSIAIPGPRGGFFTVYIIAPFVGAFIGASAYHLGFRNPRQEQVDESLVLERKN
jgi:glycerol uptake facilitator protein